MRSDGQTDWRIRSLGSGVKRSRAASAAWLFGGGRADTKGTAVSCRACNSSDWPLGLSISTSGAMGESVVMGESVSMSTSPAGDGLHLSDGCRYRSKSKPGMSSTIEVCAERHAEPRASTVVGGEEAGAGVGVPQGDSVKLRHAEVSGAWQTTAGETFETSSVTGLVVLRDS